MKREIITKKKVRRVKAWAIPWTLNTPTPGIVMNKSWADDKYRPCIIEIDEKWLKENK